jgi:hypothetical protein
MSFHLRSLSARRYRIEGDLPRHTEAAFLRRLSHRAFRPLAEKEDRTHGWVTVDNCLDAKLDPPAVERGPCAAFALRIDRRRVDSRMLRALLDLEVRGRRKDGGRLRREEKQEMRRALTEELLSKAQPSLEIHPVLVFPRERLVLFLSLSKTANETFRSLFCETFDVTLSALTPFHRAVEMLAPRGAAEALAPLRRTEFGTAGAASPTGDRFASLGGLPTSPVPASPSEEIGR